MPDYSKEIDVGIVAFGMIYDWEALWNKEASLEQVCMEERKEYIDEVMIEVTQKMKRKHKLEVMADYEILGWDSNSALVEYRYLNNEEEILRKIGSHLLKTGVIE